MVSQAKYIIATFLCTHLFTSNIKITKSLSNGTRLETNGELVKHLEPKSCTVPVTSSHITFNLLHCNGNCSSSQKYVDDFTVAEVTCAPDYFIFSKDKVDKNSTHVCHNQQWSPPITECAKKCNKLKPENVILECTRNGIDIANCDGNTILLAGTEVHSKCKSAHKYATPPNYSEITCNEDGKWDDLLLPCVPECGKLYKPLKPMISHGVKEPIGESPWHVAIFDEKKELICGGTIITAHLVVTAAHCFHSGNHCSVYGYECTPNYCNGTKCVGIFEVVVGKYHRNYTTKDPFQNTMKIKEIRFSNKGFSGIANHYAADIALLILQDSIPITQQVMPACLNWADLRYQKYPAEGKLGKVVGWGMTENGPYSTMLMGIELPYISYQRCTMMLPIDLVNALRLDKFCAGKENHTEVGTRAGDSGGGILFEDKDLYYLRGVVSVKPNGDSFLSLFTDLVYHVEWISSVRKEVEKIEINSSEPEDVPNFSEIQQFRSYLDTIEQSINNLNKSVIQSVNNLNESVIQSEINLNKSVIQSENNLNKLVIQSENNLNKLVIQSDNLNKSLIQSVNNLNKSVIQSVNNLNKSVTKLNKTLNSLKMKIYEDVIEETRCTQKWLECGKPYTRPELTEPAAISPWSVAILQEKTNDYICGGTIITEKLVVSGASCFNYFGSAFPNSCKGTKCADIYGVFVGKYHRDYTIQDPYQRTMKIKEIHFPDSYNGRANNFVANIALVILQDTIPISRQVMPACLNLENLKKHIYPLEDEPGKIVGWGPTEDGLSKILRSYNFSFASNQRCKEILSKELINPDTFCGFAKGYNSFNGWNDAGAGILFEDSGIFYLQGIISTTLLRGDAILFTDISYYIDWISSVRNSIECLKIPIKIDDGADHQTNDYDLSH